MKNTIISTIVAVICTAAICVTGFLISDKFTQEKSAEYPAYMSEKQAMEYIGIDDEILFNLLKDDLGYFDGSFQQYTYFDDNNEEITVTVYNKEKLDEVVKEYTEKGNALNFKYVQEAKAESTTAAQ